MGSEAANRNFDFLHEEFRDFYRKSAALHFILLDLVRRRPRGHYVPSGTQQFGYTIWPS